jgi:ABC-type glycerol-3-phosphate transport system substrate-binding protein
METSRRRLLRWTLFGSAATAAAGLLAACGGAPASPTAAPAAQPAEPTKPAASQPTSAPAAAAKPATSKTPVKVTLHMRSGGEKSEPAIYVDRPNEWAAETGNQYELLPIPGGKDYVPKIMALAAGNTIGDSLFTGDSYSEHTFMVRNDLIEPNDDYFSRNNIKKTEWIKAIIDTLTYQGKMYGLPKASNPAHSFINVNLKMFDEAGLKRPETYGNTFDQLADWAIKLSKGPKDKREVYGYYAALETSHPITNAVRQFGGDLVDKDGVTSLVDQEPFWNWLQWTHRLVVKEAVHPLGGVVNPGDSNALASMFAAGKLAMIHSHRAWQRPIKLPSSSSRSGRSRRAGSRTSTPTASRAPRRTRMSPSASATRWPTGASPIWLPRRRATLPAGSTIWRRSRNWPTTPSSRSKQPTTPSRRAGGGPRTCAPTSSRPS